MVHALKDAVDGMLSLVYVVHPQATISDARGCGKLFDQAFSSHAEDLRSLGRLQRTRMASVQKQFEKQLDAMAAEFKRYDPATSKQVVMKHCSHPNLLHESFGTLCILCYACQSHARLAAHLCRETAAHGLAHERHKATVATSRAALAEHEGDVRRTAHASLEAQKDRITDADVEDRAVLRLPFDERKADLMALHTCIRQVSVVVLLSTNLPSLLAFCWSI